MLQLPIRIENIEFKSQIFQISNRSKNEEMCLSLNVRFLLIWLSKANWKMYENKCECVTYANTNRTFKLQPLIFTLCGCSNIETFLVFDSIFIGFRFLFSVLKRFIFLLSRKLI